MKGIVFSEFMEMVETRFSPEIADEIIESSELPSGGMYTAVGTYDHAEILALVTRLGELTGTPPPELVRTFGRYLFGRFHILYPKFFRGVENSFDFLSRLEEHVHTEVLKLYPDAELPTFEARRVGDDDLELRYKSRRPLAELALGLMQGCADHYGERVEIERTDLPRPDCTEVHFTLRRR
jgi:hypothetical protein